MQSVQIPDCIQPFDEKSHNPAEVPVDPLTVEVATGQPGAKKKRSRHGRKKKGNQTAPGNETETCLQESRPLSEGFHIHSSKGELGKDADCCNKIIAKLQGSDARCMLEHVLPMVKTLAFQKYGCRVVQEAIKVGQKHEHARLIDELKGKITDLYKSPHGNHVVSKMIEVLPPTSLEFMIKELEGSMVELAKHQYGCRLVERILEYCPDAKPLEELLVEAETLCRHLYGNFVMQHIFEHGSKDWKDQVAQQLVQTLPQLAKHRTASHVVQKALECGDEVAQRSFAMALMNGKEEDSLIDVACNRYGSFVIEELAALEFCCEDVRSLLRGDLWRLSESPFGRRVLAKFELISEIQGIQDCPVGLQLVNGGYPLP
jgi:hypothetical protein